MKYSLFFGFFIVSFFGIQGQEKLKTADYFQYLPSATYLTQSAFEKPNEFKKEMYLLGGATVLMVPTVKLLKKTTQIERPDGSDFNSFPSVPSQKLFLCKPSILLTFTVK
jgi:hypothetical protein